MILILPPIKEFSNQLLLLLLIYILIYFHQQSFSFLLNFCVMLLHISREIKKKKLRAFSAKIISFTWFTLARQQSLKNKINFSITTENCFFVCDFKYRQWWKDAIASTALQQPLMQCTLFTEQTSIFPIGFLINAICIAMSD